MGGKTGTAQKLPRGSRNYLVSFIGNVPAEDPEVMIYVVVDQPNVEDQPHSTYAPVSYTHLSNGPGRNDIIYR